METEYDEEINGAFGDEGYEEPPPYTTDYDYHDEDGPVVTEEVRQVGGSDMEDY